MPPKTHNIINFNGQLYELHEYQTPYLLLGKFRQFLIRITSNLPVPLRAFCHLHQKPQGEWESFADPTFHHFVVNEKQIPPIYSGIGVGVYRGEAVAFQRLEIESLHRTVARRRQGKG